MMKRFSVCAAGLFAAILVAQPATAQTTWIAVSASGNTHSSNPADWTQAVVGSTDENLYQVSLADGSLTYLRGLRNNVDAYLAANGSGGFPWPPAGQNGPFWGESYRDGQHIAYNPDDGLLWARNGTTGYRAPDPLDPRAYDTRLIETYNPGANGEFQAAPVSVYNSLLTTRFGGLQPDNLDPNNPIDGTVFDESRSFTYDTDNHYFILANNNGNTGYWDPANAGVPASSVHVGSDPGSYKGLAFYDTNLDGGATANRLFAGVNDNGGGYTGDSFFELDNNPASATYLTDLSGGFPTAIILSGTGDTMAQMEGLAQDPGTGDLYGIATMSLGGRALIRFDAADVDAFTAGDPFINATYLGVTATVADGEIDQTSITFIPVTAGCEGDINGDGKTDGLDYLVWAGNYGTSPGVGTGPGNGDLNNDGNVDGLDYLIWAGDFGCGTATAVPEPATFALAGLALAGLLVSRRRRS